MPKLPDHSICPWMLEPDRVVLNLVLLADLIKGMDLLRPAVFRDHLVDELAPRNTRSEPFRGVDLLFRMHFLDEAIWAVDCEL